MGKVLRRILSAVLTLMLCGEVFAQQIDCHRLQTALQSGRGDFTPQQIETMTTVYNRECTVQQGKPSEGKPGREAMIERERACGREWREAKAAGKIQPDQTWPKYWSACNERMKANGM